MMTFLRVVVVSEKSIRPLSFWLQQFLRDNPALAEGAREREKLRAAFRLIADAETAAHAEPLRIRDDCLHLAAASPVWASRLRHRRTTLLRQIKTAVAKIPAQERSATLEKISRVSRLQIQIRPDTGASGED